MIVASNLIRNPYRWDQGLINLQRMPSTWGGVSGLSAYDPFAPPPVPGSLAHPEAPCAPGLEYVNGSCFRVIGETGNPVAGPAANNQEAMRILGGGAVCAAEKVDVGPYVYTQNICRDKSGNVIAGADAVAEHAFVQRSLNTPVSNDPRSVVPGGSNSSSSSSSTGGGTAAKKESVPVGNGTGSGSQKQSPTQAPDTVQKSTESFPTPELLQTEDGEVNWILIAALAAGAYFIFVKGKK